MNWIIDHSTRPTPSCSVFMNSKLGENLHTIDTEWEYKIEQIKWIKLWNTAGKGTLMFAVASFVSDKLEVPLEKL